MLILVTNVNDIHAIFYPEDSSVVPTSFTTHTDAYSGLFENSGSFASEQIDWKTAVEFDLSISPQSPAFVFAASTNFATDPPNSARFTELDMNADQPADILCPGNAFDIAHQDQPTNVDADTIQQSDPNDADREVPRKRYESFVPFANV
jgi:hypothetical protein